jgi:L-rhamnose mutarotase
MKESRSSYGMTLLLRDDAAVIDRYKAEHAAAWPEVISRLREVGILELRIFLLGRRLFLYLEAEDGFDPDRDFGRLDDDPYHREWNALMTSLQEQAPEAAPGEWWARMEKVFDLNWPQYRDK